MVSTCSRTSRRVKSARRLRRGRLVGNGGRGENEVMGQPLEKSSFQYERSLRPHQSGLWTRKEQHTARRCQPDRYELPQRLLGGDRREACRLWSVKPELECPWGQSSWPDGD